MVLLNASSLSGSSSTKTPGVEGVRIQLSQRLSQQNTWSRTLKMVQRLLRVQTWHARDVGCGLVAPSEMRNIADSDLEHRNEQGRHREVDRKADARATTSNLTMRH